MAGHDNKNGYGFNEIRPVSARTNSMQASEEKYRWFGGVVVLFWFEFFPGEVTVALW